MSVFWKTDSIYHKNPNCWVDCCGFNNSLRQYFSLYCVIRERERERDVKTNPTHTYCKHSRSILFYHPNYWNFTSYRSDRKIVISCLKKGLLFFFSFFFILAKKKSVLEQILSFEMNELHFQGKQLYQPFLFFFPSQQGSLGKGKNLFSWSRFYVCRSHFRRALSSRETNRTSQKLSPSEK